METITIKVKSDKARRLIKDLEDLDILEVVELPQHNKVLALTNISDLKMKISSPMDEETINQQIEQIRNEWQPNI